MKTGYHVTPPKTMEFPGLHVLSVHEEHLQKKDCDCCQCYPKHLKKQQLRKIPDLCNM